MAGMENTFSAIVGSGTVAPATFVSWLTSAQSGQGLSATQPTAGYAVYQTPGSTTIPCGVSQIGTRLPPTDENSASGYAGSVSGSLGRPDPIQIYGLGARMVMLTLGSTVANGQFLMPDASGGGTGVPAASGGYYGAQAEEEGVAGDMIRVTVIIGKA